MYESYLRWIEVCYPNPDDPYDKIWHNKIPFLEVGNGDFIAFDIQKGKDIYPVMYLSHDGDDFHGSCLANSFVEFITNWSNIGCIGTECWTLEIFYDKDKNKLMSDSPLIDEWKEALLKD